MKIHDEEQIAEFETVGGEALFYMTLVQYQSGSWHPGPCGHHKPDVVRALQNWPLIEAARIYTVKVPVKSISGA